MHLLLAVQLVRCLAQPLAPAREQRMVGVPRVAPGAVAGKHQRGQRAQRVRPRRQRPHRQRGEPPVVLAHVGVAVARELDDPPPATRCPRESCSRCMIVAAGTYSTDQPASRARRCQSTSSEYTKNAGSSGPTCSNASRRTSIPADCTQSTSRVSSPRLCTVSRRCSEHGAGERGPDAREAPGRRLRRSVRGRRSRAPAAAARGSRSSASRSASAAPGVSSESSFSSRHQRPRARAHQLGVVLRLAPPALAARSARRGRRSAR